MNNNQNYPRELQQFFWLAARCQSCLGMSSLSIFPTEILECITSMVSTSQQMRLWQCGDGILHLKLRNGGLKRTSLEWSRSSWMPWPRWFFAIFDHLQHVEWDVNFGTSLCPTLELNLLPKTLKRLHLSCEDVFLVLRKQNVHMNDLLPMLDTLHLSGSRLCEENLKHFPSNLIELRVDSRGMPIESSTIFCDLPRGIQRLTLGFNIADQSEHANDLPSGLVSLDIMSIKCNFNWLSKLPQSLKSLKMDYVNFNPLWDTLPFKLEELQLAFQPLKQEAIPQLPQSLKTLVLSHIHCMALNDELKLVSLLPKNLTRFKLSQGEMSPSELQNLPVTLTDFEVNISAKRSDVLSLFHPQMTRIHLGSGPFAEKLIKFPLPTKLQYLSIPCINDDICALLPPGLQVLHCQEGLITTKGSSKLPKSLSSLKTHLKVFKNNEAMSYLRHIAIIQLSTEGTPLGELDSNWLSSLLPSGIDDNGNNYHLTSLTIDGGSRWGDSTIDPHLQKPFFHSIQKFKNLNRIGILDCGGISSDWLYLIPQNVTSLNLSLSTLPTANHLAMLPTCLKSLNLGVGNQFNVKCDWSDEVLQSLPRSLHRFWINATEYPNLTQRMYEYLPPNLQYSPLNYKGRDSFHNFIPPLDRLYGSSTN